MRICSYQCACNHIRKCLDRSSDVYQIFGNIKRTSVDPRSDMQVYRHSCCWLNVYIDEKEIPSQSWKCRRGFIYLQSSLSTRLLQCVSPHSATSCPSTDWPVSLPVFKLASLPVPEGPSLVQSDHIHPSMTAVQLLGVSVHSWWLDRIFIDFHTFPNDLFV